jgi:drug/metabolite transporter (DMT)-like permease
MDTSFFANIDFTFLAILSAFFAAIATVLARILLKQLKSQDILGVTFLTMGATLVLLSPLFYEFKATGTAMGILFIIALIDTVANYFYFKTFEKTEASVASPILSLAPAFTFLFAWVFLSDVVSLPTFLVSMLIIILVVIFSVNFKQIKKFTAATFIPAIISSTLFGVSAIPAKYLLTNLEVINAPTLYMFRAGYIALLSLLLFQFSIRQLSIMQFRIIFVRGLFVIAQWILLYYALTFGNAGVAVTLGNITPIFVFIMGVIFLREKITMKKAIAALLILFLSFFI